MKYYFTWKKAFTILNPMKTQLKRLYLGEIVPPRTVCNKERQRSEVERLFERKKPCSPSYSPRIDQGSQASSPDHGEHQLNKVKPKHPLCAQIFDKHVQPVNGRLNYYIVGDASKCKLLALTLVALARLWFNGILDGFIVSWANFYDRLTTHFTAWKRQLVIVAALCSIMLGDNEILWSYIDRFTQVT